MTRQQQIAESLHIYRERILQVQRFIEEHLASHLTVDRLARVARFSPFHFHRIFAELTGEPLMAYVKRLRLEKAATLLVGSMAGVAEISQRIGYETPESFSRAFRQQFGMSPTAWRDTVGPELVPPAITRTASQKQRAVAFVESPNPDVQIKRLDQKLVAFVRHIGPYWRAGMAWTQLLQWLTERNLPTWPQWAIAWDEPEITPHDKLRYDACVEVTDDFEANTGIGLQILASGMYATLEHAGPMQTLGNCYREVYGRWMPVSGYQPRNAPPLIRMGTSVRRMLDANTSVELCVPIEPIAN